MRSEQRAEVVPAPASGNLMRRERAPPVLVEVTDTGDTEELIEVPEGQEEEYYAAADDAVDPTIQWGAPARSPEEQAKQEEEDAKFEAPGSVIEIKDPALKSTPGPVIQVPTEKIFGVQSVRGWDMYAHAPTDSATTTGTSKTNLRR